MARLLILFAFAFVASLYSPTYAGWFGKKVKRTDLGEDCPTCGAPPPQFSHGSWIDWSLTSSSLTFPSYVPESSSTIPVPASAPKGPSSGFSTVTVSEIDTFISTFSTQTVWFSTSTSTDSMPVNTVTNSENTLTTTSSSSEGAPSSAAAVSSTFESILPAASSSSSDSTPVSSTISSSTTAETSAFPSESFQSSSASGQSTSVASASSTSTAAETSTPFMESIVASSSSSDSASAAFTASTASTATAPSASSSEPDASSSLTSASSGNSLSSSTSNEPSSEGISGMSTSEATPPSSSGTASGSSSAATSSSHPSSQSTAPSSQPVGASQSPAFSPSDSSPASTTTSQSSEAATSSQLSLPAGSSAPQSSSIPSVSAGSSDLPFIPGTLFSTEETTEIFTSFSTTVSQESTTFVTVVKSTIFSVQILSSTVPAAPGPPVPESTISPTGALGGLTISPSALPSNMSTGTCTDDSCTNAATITWPPDEPVPDFEPSVSTPTLSALSLIGPPPACSYSLLQSSLSTSPPLPSPLFYKYYTLDPWCWTYPIPLPGFGDVSTTTIDNLGIVVAQSSAYCVCPRCWLGSDNICYENPPSRGHCGEGWWCAVTTDSSTVAHALPSGLRTDGRTPAMWDSFTDCPFTNKGHKSTSSVSYTATLSHSTKPIAGGYVDFPSFQWQCQGKLCKDSCGNLVKVTSEVIKCILSLFTKCKVCAGLSGFQFPPPPPPFPPIPDPPQASLTLPTTHCTVTSICTAGDSDVSATASGDGQSNTPTSAQSSGSSETSSSSSSSSSCSSTTFRSCSEVVSNSNVTLSGSNVTSLTTSTSCTTITACTGSGTTTISTLNSSTAAACTLSPWWNDPTISAQIALWITQFPPIPDNGTFFTNANATQTPMVAKSTSFLTSTSHTTSLGAQISITPSPSPRTTPTTSTSTSTSHLLLTTLTSTGTESSLISIYTCAGLSKSGSATCEFPWSLETVIATTPPEAARTSFCVAWAPSISTTAAPSHKALDCATPVSGKATSTLQAGWQTGMPISPFHIDNSVASPQAIFCQGLEDSNIVIVPPVLDELNTPLGAWARGECQVFSGGALTKLGYNITLQLVYDSDGCDNNDKYTQGISMKKYGWENCRDIFHDKVADECQFSDNSAEHLGLGDWNMVGGVYWQDCMRWTIIAVKDDMSQVDTSPFK